MKYIITGNDYTSDLFKSMPPDIKLICEDSCKMDDLVIEDQDLCYIPSETALGKALPKFKNENFKHKVMQLKDKVLFRDLMSHFYNDFFYQKIHIEDLTNLKLDPSKHYILKPVRGFFGTGVYDFYGDSSLLELKNKFLKDITEKSGFWDAAVLTKEEVIVESYLEGEELAVDMFFDQNYEAQIVNIYHHPISDKNSYFHALYYTGEQIFNDYLSIIKNFFKKMNTVFKACNFPIHAEFKVYNNKLFPIEMNPLRFGGFGLGDLTYHAFNINPFKSFFNSEVIDWEVIWRSRKNLYYGWILAYNGDQVDLNNMVPDYDKFKSMLRGETLKFVDMNYLENPVFAIVYQKTKEFSDLSRFLSLEFNDFFIKK